MQVTRTNGTIVEEDQRNICILVSKNDVLSYKRMVNQDVDILSKEYKELVNTIVSEKVNNTVQSLTTRPEDYSNDLSLGNGIDIQFGETLDTSQGIYSEEDIRQTNFNFLEGITFFMVYQSLEQSTFTFGEMAFRTYNVAGFTLKSQY